MKWRRHYRAEQAEQNMERKAQRWAKENPMNKRKQKEDKISSRRPNSGRASTSKFPAPHQVLVSVTRETNSSNTENT